MKWNALYRKDRLEMMVTIEANNGLDALTEAQKIVNKQNIEGVELVSLTQEQPKQCNVVATGVVQIHDDGTISIEMIETGEFISYANWESAGYFLADVSSREE